MKTVVLKEKLKEGLEVTERVAVKSSSLPILQNVLLGVEQKRARLSATDLQMGVLYEFLATTEKEGQVVFPARFLYSVLGISKEDRVELEVKNKELQVVIGQQTLSIKTLDPEDFPIIPSVKGDETSFEVETSVLCKGLAQVVGMVGQSQVRPEISGVFFVFSKKELRVVATDSFRLAEKTFQLEKEGVPEQSFILPAKTARELIATFAERPGKTQIYLSPTQAIFDYMAKDDPSQVRLQIVSRLIEGEYPHYEDVIPSSHKTRLLVEKEAFIAYVKAAGVFAGKTSEVRLSVEPAQKSVEFFSHAPDVGEQRSQLSCEVQGAGVEVAFNWRFLLDGLLQLKGNEVEFLLNGEDGPALLRQGEQQGYRYVIMPIKA